MFSSLFDIIFSRLNLSFRVLSLYFSIRRVMDSRSELIFQNGLPKERSFTDAEILAMEDRLATSYETPEPPSDPLTSEPSSGDIFQPPSDGNLPRVKSDSVDLVYKRQAVAY